MCTVHREGNYTATVVIHGPGRNRTGKRYRHYTEVVRIRVLAATHEVATRLQVRFLTLTGPRGHASLIRRLLHGRFVVTQGSVTYRSLGVRDGLERFDGRYQAVLQGDRVHGAITLQVKGALDATTGQPRSAIEVEQRRLHGTLARPDGLFPFDDDGTLRMRVTLTCRSGAGS